MTPPAPETHAEARPTMSITTSERCPSCGVAVAVDQRYCVECGLHRVGVRDPAAAFVNQAPGRSERAGRARAAAVRRGRVVTALMLALIPVAIGIGVLVGRSSNDQDGALRQALRDERARVVTVQSAGARVITVAGSGAVVRVRAKASGRGATRAAARATAVGATETKAQQKQSQTIVTRLNNSTGSSYLDPVTSQVGGG